MTEIDEIASLDAGALERTVEGNGGEPGATAHRPTEASHDGEPVELQAQTVGIVLITAGGERRLRVAHDVAASELVPELVSHCGEDESEEWTLACPDGRLVSPDQTLEAAGIRDSDQLALIPRHAVRRGPVADGTGGQGNQGGSARTGGPVSERTAATLPAKPGPGPRVKAVWRALFCSGVELAPGVPDGHVNPASLAQEPRQSIVKRCVQAARQAGYEHLLEQLIRAPVLQRSVVIAVMSGKGGVGKTTCSSLLGSMFAFLRGDRVIAVDANPDFGMLGVMLAPGQGMMIDELLAGPLARNELSITELDAALARGPDGLLICPGPVEPDRCEKLGTADYLRLFERLRQQAGILVVDCGTSFTSEPAKAVLRVADQLVLVADDTMQAAAVAIYAGRWLRPQRYPVTLALNKRDGRGYINLNKLEESLPDARALATIPTDKAAVAQLSGSRRFSWRDDRDELGTSMRELAALLASDWQRLGLAMNSAEAS